MQALLCLTSLFGSLEVMASTNTAAPIESPRIPTVHSCQQCLASRKTSVSEPVQFNSNYLIIYRMGIVEEQYSWVSTL